MAFSDITKADKTTVMKYGFPAGVENISKAATALSVFPNPSHGSFTLHISAPQKETATITITNMLGKKVQQFIASTNEDVVVRVNAAPGVYFVSAKTQYETVTEKILVE